MPGVSSVGSGPSSAGAQGGAKKQLTPEQEEKVKQLPKNKQAAFKKALQEGDAAAVGKIIKDSAKVMGGLSEGIADKKLKSEGVKASIKDSDEKLGQAVLNLDQDASSSNGKAQVAMQNKKAS